MINFKGAHFENEMILTCVRWYVAYPLSYRYLEEMIQERGIAVDHATIHRWVLRYTPQLEQAFRTRQRPVGPRWRLDETDIKVKGEWKYLYQAGDKAGQTVDFLRTAQRDAKAVTASLRKSPLMTVGPARSRSSMTRRSMRLALKSASSSISTTLWNKMIAA